MNHTELLAIGGAYVDINCHHFPFGEQGLLPETETVGNGYEVVPGGSAVNFARLCAALKIPTMFIGKTGADAVGEILAELLLQAGVQPELIVDKNVTTNLSFNTTNEAAKTIMTVVGNANQSLTPEEVYGRASAVLNTCTHLYLGGCFKLKALLPALEKLAAEAQETNTLVVLDHGRVNNSVGEDEKKAVRQLALQADYYLPSRDEFCELWEVPTIEEGLRLLAIKSPKTTVVVKDAEQGAITLQDGKILRSPIFPVQVIHTVGAGDSFNAGFIAAQSRGESVIDSMRFGCATAALKISQRELPTWRKVTKLISK